MVSMLDLRDGLQIILALLNIWLTWLAIRAKLKDASTSAKREKRQ